MTLATFHVHIRAAMRAHLAGVVDIDHAPGAVTAAGGSYTRASGSWIDAGFAIGQEVQVSGFAGGADGTVRVTGLSGAVMTTTGQGSGSAAAPRFLVALPAARAWEGQSYYPSGEPYVSEVFQPLESTRRGAGPDGLLEHAVMGAWTLFYPHQVGTLAIERMAGAVMARFRPGTRLERQGAGVFVQQARRSQLIVDGDWVSLTVTANALGFTAT
jgi:hypothetical protein